MRETEIHLSFPSFTFFNYPIVFGHYKMHYFPIKFFFFHRASLITVGPPHLGHAYSALIGDALARWHRMCGQNVLLSTGTDEHGSKVQAAAKAAGVPPQTHVDQISSGLLSSPSNSRKLYIDFKQTNVY